VSGLDKATLRDNVLSCHGSNYRRILRQVPSLAGFRCHYTSVIFYS